jgi:hypothetical protein
VSGSDASLAALGLLVLRLRFLGDDTSFTSLVIPRSLPRAPSFQADDCDENKQNGDDNDEGNVHLGPVHSFEGRRNLNISQVRHAARR